MVKIFVGNCSDDSTSDELRTAFSQYGRVTEADIISGKGFGFVHMDSQADADAAVSALDGTNFCGQKIRVEFSSGGRGGRGGGFGGRGGGGGGPMRREFRNSSRGGGGGDRFGGRDYNERSGRDHGSNGRDYGSGRGNYSRSPIRNRGSSGRYEDNPYSRGGSDQYQSKYRGTKGCVYTVLEKFFLEGGYWLTFCVTNVSVDNQSPPSYQSRSSDRRQRSPPPPERVRPYSTNFYEQHSTTDQGYNRREPSDSYRSQYDNGANGYYERRAPTDAYSGSRGGVGASDAGTYYAGRMDRSPPPSG
uniref:RRM domain-containing protein n=1 Tax=Romanomermis culicivorax TaxID=13658 RepID=A0A915L4P9_ROMCU